MEKVSNGEACTCFTLLEVTEHEVTEDFFFVFVITVGRKLSTCFEQRRYADNMDVFNALFLYSNCTFLTSLSADVRKDKVKGNDNVVTTDVFVVITSLQIDDVRLIVNIVISQYSLCTWMISVGIYEEHYPSTLDVLHV